MRAQRKFKPYIHNPHSHTVSQRATNQELFQQQNTHLEHAHGLKRMADGTNAGQKAKVKLRAAAATHLKTAARVGSLLKKRGI